MPGPSCEPPMGLPDDTQTMSSQSSQSYNEQEVSIWVDEMEDQQQKKKSLNEALGSISSGRFSPVLSTLNTSWGDISNTQQRYYNKRLLRQLVPRFPYLSWTRKRDMEGSVSSPNSVRKSKSCRVLETKYFDRKSGIIDALVKAHRFCRSCKQF